MDDVGARFPRPGGETPPLRQPRVVNPRSGCAFGAKPGIEIPGCDAGHGTPCPYDKTNRIELGGDSW